VCEWSSFAVPQATTAWLCNIASINVFTALVTQAPAKLKELRDTLEKGKDKETGVEFRARPNQQRLLTYDIRFRVKVMLSLTFLAIVASFLYSYLKQFPNLTQGSCACAGAVLATWGAALCSLAAIVLAGDLLWRLVDAQGTK
jgi:hypothetical protein